MKFTPIEISKNVNFEAILKNYEFARSLSYSNRSMKTKVQRRKNQRSSKRNVCYTDQKTQ